MPDRFPFGIIGRHQLRPAPSGTGRSEFPAKIRGIVDRRVIALSAGGREQMGRIAREEYPPVRIGITLGDQCEPGGPGRRRDQFRGNSRPVASAISSRAYASDGSIPRGNWACRTKRPSPSMAAVKARQVRLIAQYCQLRRGGTTS